MPDLTLTAPPATADLFPAGTPAPAPDMMAALAALMAALQPKAPAPAAPVIPAPPVAEPGPEKVTLGTISKITTRSKWWDVLEACLAAGLNRILLVGPPGTGKSTTADTDGLRVTCHEDAGPESMIGTFIQKDGNTVWVDGPTSIAMRAGKRVVSDEFDHNSPECLSLAYATLDDSPSIMLPTGEYLVAKSGYQLIGTSNSSPSDFPEAILDRFEAIIVAAEPHPNAVKIVKAQAGTKADALTGLMNNYYRGLNTTQYAFRGNPTLRKCRNFAKLLDAGLDENVAAQVVFGNAAKEILSAMTTSSAKVGE
jgi:nitric oxide reductase NorQ protein